MYKLNKKHYLSFLKLLLWEIFKTTKLLYVTV